jgi:ATP-dependent DNA ligase
MKKWEFPSTSNPNQKHTVTLANGSIICSCRGFRTPNRCWHARKIAEQEGVKLVLTTTESKSITEFATQVSLLETGKEMPISPMLARGLKDDESISDFSSAEFCLEEKYNGHRIEIEIGSEITAWSRAGNIRMLPSQIIKELRKMPYGIFDGELYIPGGQSTDVKAIHLQDQLELVLFDVMKFENESVIEIPLIDRRTILETAVAIEARSRVLYLSDQFEPSTTKLKEIWDRGGEGAILKSLFGKYEIGNRSKTWIKLKKEISEVAKIVGFENGLLGPHSKVVAVDKDGVEVRVKMLNDEWRARLDQEGGDKYVGWNLRFNHQGRTRGKNKFLHPMMDHIFRD